MSSDVFMEKKLIVNFFKKLRYTTFLRMEIQFWNGWWDNKLSFSSFHFLMPLCRASEFWERNLHKKIKCFFHRLDSTKRMEVGIGNQAIIMSWNVGKTIWRGNLIEVQGIVCKKSKIWNWKLCEESLCVLYFIKQLYLTSKVMQQLRCTLKYVVPQYYFKIWSLICSNLVIV